MYTDNEKLFDMERIHHMDRTAESQHSWHQKLILGEDPNADKTWTADDFTFDGTTITGFSESGIEKRKDNTDLVLPNKNPDGEYVTAIADYIGNGNNGMFATADEKFTSVTLPAKLERLVQKFSQTAVLRRLNFQKH